MNSQTLQEILDEAYKAYQKNKFKDAIENYLKAINLVRDKNQILEALGLAYFADNQFEKSADCFLKFLEKNPDKPDCHYHLALVYQSQNNWDKAVFHYQKEINLRPKTALSYNNLGLILMQKNQFDEAIDMLNHALMLNPEHPQAYLNLAQTYLQASNFEEALKYYQKLKKLNVSHIDISLNEGTCFLRLKKYNDAEKIFHDILKQNPHYEKALFNLASLYLEQKKSEEALKIYEKLKNTNDSPEFYFNWCAALLDDCQYQKAQIHLDEAQKKWPQHLKIQFLKNLGLPRAYHSDEELKTIRKNFETGLNQLINNYKNESIHSESLLQIMDNHTNFLLGYQGEDDYELQKKYGELHTSLIKSQTLKKYKHDKIRVAYVSPHFKNHSISKTTIGFLKHHTKNEFEIYTYYLGDEIEERTKDFQKFSDTFVKLPMQVEAVSQQSLKDEIDILFLPDIGMAPITNALAARRLAAIQCTTLGHPITTGYPNIDYFISSLLMEEGAIQHYSEKLICLPDLGFSYPEFKLPKNKKTRIDFGLNEENFIYICGQSLVKMTPEYDYLFGFIAKEVSNSQILFIESKSKGETQIFKNRIQKEFEKLNLDFEKQCFFLPRLSENDFHHIHLLSDVFLDSSPWAANNSLLETWSVCDIPAVIMPGKFMRSRHTLAMLKMIHLDECIANNPQEYINTAVKLAKKPDFYQSVVQKIKNNKSVLFDNADCVRVLEGHFKNWLGK